ncbi:MAG: aminotransferase class III-fold pyridoxal phosphate-dependent enzyme [Planctomycetota bacterium]|nr:aminotransferase class III-fold pyridoxal phosphate-dependent enzyme [Planctomycetota bacterium]
MATRPDYPALASVILEEHWGFSAALTRLPGENLNFRVDVPGAPPRVFKLTMDPQADVELEEALLEHLTQAGFAVPTSIPTPGAAICIETSIAGHHAIARLQRYLGGTSWRETETTSDLLFEIGAYLGQVHQTLSTFSHPGAQRTHLWDLAQANRHLDAIQLIDTPDRRRTIEHCFHLYRACGLSLLSKCPQGMLHGDANDENILVDSGQVAGILDVGDCQMGALVQDLAILLSYALQQEGVTVEAATPLLAGYQSIRSLTPFECESLVPLAIARMATSICVAETRRVGAPDHETWFSHQESTWATLESILDHSPAELMAILMNHASTGDASELRDARSQLIGPSLSLSYDSPLHIVRGRGQYLLAVDGQPYLDLVNNVCHVGHCHPRVVAAIAKQAAVLNTNSRYLHDNITNYAQRLCDTLPEGLDVCYFVNSGSEANELALRLARAATASRDVLVIDGAYHGHTSSCIEMSPYKFKGPGGGPQASWVHVVPMPDVYRGELRDEDAGSGYALEVGRVIGEACAAGGSIAAFFAETMLSCGGQIPLPEGYLPAAFEHVRRAGGVCIADEVQVGFGRVGDAFWGFELSGVLPDIVVMGKPIGNGHPLGAVVTTRAIAEAFDNGMEFFSTFGGNPVSCACGLAVLDVIEEEGLQERARVLGQRFKAGLEALRERHEIIGDVRGRGLFLGMELVRDRQSLEPAPTEASALVNTMKERGVLLSTDGPLHNVIKIKPPMVLSAEDIDMTVRLLDEVLSGQPLQTS